jgi:hypothetical protein
MHQQQPTTPENAEPTTRKQPSGHKDSISAMAAFQKATQNNL